MGILDGKSAVVTGAGRGIGRGHCLHLAENGASVVVNDIDLDEARKVVEEIAAAGGKAAASEANIGSRAGAEALIAQAVDEFGSIDIVVNNAGNVRDRSFLKMSDEELEAVLQVHVKGTFWCSQAAALRMRDQGSGGSIVNTVSAARWGNFGQTNYAGAKGMIEGMTMTWALELARYGIRVNAISPSGSTRMSATYKGKDGKPVELPFVDPALNGPMVVYLCSDEADWITGQVFGTGGDRVLIVEAARYGTGIFQEGGWTVDGLREQFPKVFRDRLQPVGLFRRAYQFLDGVKPPPQE